VALDKYDSPLNLRTVYLTLISYLSLLKIGTQEQKKLRKAKGKKKLQKNKNEERQTPPKRKENKY